ncbi:hypothetical protein PENTCL1PPCAC_2594, partial [Pristionchus entomophagus]
WKRRRNGDGNGGREGSISFCRLNGCGERRRNRKRKFRVHWISIDEREERGRNERRGMSSSQEMRSMENGRGGGIGRGRGDQSEFLPHIPPAMGGFAAAVAKRKRDRDEMERCDGWPEATRAPMLTQEERKRRMGLMEH